MKNASTGMSYPKPILAHEKGIARYEIISPTVTSGIKKKLEYLIVADPETGLALPILIERELAHEIGEPHLATHTYVTVLPTPESRKRKVALQKRAEGKVDGGRWDVLVGGHAGYINMPMTKLKKLTFDPAKQANICLKNAKRESWEEVRIPRDIGNKMQYLGTIAHSDEKIVRGKPYKNSQVNIIYGLKYDLPLSTLRPRRGEVERVDMFDLDFLKAHVASGFQPVLLESGEVFQLVQRGDGSYYHQVFEYLEEMV